jgi:ABC-type cobalamin/Fe3+-siderophores transport system ATPase subunit
MRLTQFTIQNYKIIDDTGSIKADPNVTALVGKNESGKTGVLRALWKSRNRAKAEFDKLTDFPRSRYSRERKQAQWVVHTTFGLTPEDSKAICATVKFTGGPVKSVVQKTWYSNEESIGRSFHIPELEVLRKSGAEVHAVADAVILAFKTTTSNIPEALAAACESAKALVPAGAELWGKEAAPALASISAALLAAAPDVQMFAAEKEKVASLLAESKAGDPLAPALKWVEENLPVFIYFDDYGQLETRISLPGYLAKIAGKPDARTRTQRALFTWSGLDPKEILDLGRVRDQNETDESVQRRKDKRRALLQSASFSLTGDWVDWWAEKGHKLHFDADGEDLVLQVSDSKNEFPIPFEERSQGFQWFFSFFLVFLVESEHEHQDAILLLDEPGLHLHPTLQSRLIDFFDRIAKKNQVIYSTHLPFLIDGSHLDRVRTVYLDKETSKTIVSPDVRAGADYDTLFPIQAALGYSMAQTLFLGKKCVIVEGITDYWILKVLQTALALKGSADLLDKEAVLVPAGGTSRLMPLASLMFAAAGVSGKNMLVLLDSDKEGLNASKRLEADLFHGDSRVILLGSAIGKGKATIEDMMDRSTYLSALVGAGYAVKFDAAEIAEQCNVDAAALAFKRLGLGDFDHVAKTKAARWIADTWLEKPAAIGQDVLNNAASLFRELNSRFASTG